MENKRSIKAGELQKSVVRQIKHCMIDYNIHQSGLCKKINKTPACMTHLLQGKMHLTVNTIEDIAIALGYKVIILFEKDDSVVK